MAKSHGKPHHPQSQGSVERANGDIKDTLLTWLADSNSQDWSVGIKFVQFQKNAAHHSGIKCFPYSAMSGCEARVGLTSSSLPTEVGSSWESEDDLIADHQEQIQKRRVEAYRGQVSQAERMVKRSCLGFEVGEPGDNVAVPNPAVDRGREDPRNILGVIVSRDLDNDQYKIAVKSGVLKGQYSRN
ncbi:KRAB-A domain-containing protein 2-like [Penaeus monodon]|uniref:KRAB-A domain-containing protein 2-like n=1 Tax=Penaeus monodon TaxID=6687 RepID=UPI0018A7955C|nr:KRAB-A domain-containing protein 2-like [Penaeus monodon]